MGVSMSQYLTVQHSAFSSLTCPAAPPGAVEAGYGEIQGQCSLVLALHPGKSLAAWSVNKMLNLQPVICCAAC